MVRLVEQRLSVFMQTFINGLTVLGQAFLPSESPFHR